MYTGILISKSSFGFKLLPVSFKAGVWSTVLKGPSDKQENCYEWLLAFRFVYDSVCLHSALLNWLRNRLEMVLLLYTSHNSPSHQSWAIFYLEDDVSIRVCQPLTAALWVVVLGESIVNQHNNNNKISLAATCTSLGRGTAVHQMTAHPEHTQEQAHRHTWCLSISLALFYFLSLIFLHTQTQKFTDLTKSDNRYTEKKTELGQRECVCQLFLTSFSVSSKVWGAHKVLLPIWQHIQSPNTELGLFQRLKPHGSLPSMLLSSLTSSLDMAHVSGRALVLEIRIVSKHQATHRARALFALYHSLSLCVCWPGLVTLLVLMRTWLCPVCVGRQRHTLWSHSGSFN